MKEASGNLASRPSSSVATGRRYSLNPYFDGDKERFAKSRENLSKAREGKSAKSDLAAPGKPSGEIHVRGYSAPNWLTVSGVCRKRRLIELRGLPSFHKWRFITLTINPELFPDGPLSAFLAGREHMRRFMTKARESALWSKAHKWAWKLEFQENGWPHWHLLVGRTEIFSEFEMAEIGRLWGLGRTNVEMVQENDFRYTFKYAFKPVQMIEDEQDDFDGLAPVAPQWFLDYMGAEMVTVNWTDEDGVKHSSRELKPTSGARVRFWQTSRGFYSTPAKAASDKKEPNSCKVPLPVRVIAQRIERTVQIVARKGSGNYVASGLVLLTCAAATLWTLAGWHAVNGGALFLGINSAVVPLQIIEQKTENRWQLTPLTNQNRLSLRQAGKLLNSRNWQRC